MSWRWILLAAAAGFAASAVLTRAFELQRHAFVAVWTVVVVLVCVAYARRERVGVGFQLRRRWLAGALIGITVGLLLAVSVVRQPGSQAPTGTTLGVDLVWLGVVYGVADALMLSVLPVLALYGSRPGGVLQTSAGRLQAGAIALAGSALVTAAYHVGFEEFQSAALIQPVLGNLAITAAYLLSGSALAPKRMAQVWAMPRSAAPRSSMPKCRERQFAVIEAPG